MEKGEREHFICFLAMSKKDLVTLVSWSVS